jgi:predicted transcriptional regulator
MNDISKDDELKNLTFRLMEKVTKRGYWCWHEIVFINEKKTLTIHIQETKAGKEILRFHPMFNIRAKNEQKILKVINNNPGIRTKEISEKISVTRRATGYILKSLLERKLISVKGTSKSDPTRQYYPANFKLKIVNKRK